MRKIKTKAELKALGDQFPEPAPAVEFEEAQCSILEPVFFCHICSKVFESEEELTNHEINHMKLTCGLCNKNFKSKAAFEEHDKDHPSVEKMSTFQKMQFKIGKHKFECSVCKKKFKNETSLNYHEMFHTDDERKAAEGIKVTPSVNCIQGKINYKDFDSEDDDFDSPPKRKGKNKKVLRKRNSNPAAKKVVEKTESQSNLTKNRLIMETDDDSEFETTSTKSVKNKSSQEQTKCTSIPSTSSLVKTNPTQPIRLSRPFSEISGDSDSESGSCDSKYLSLKHISRSMKKTSKPVPIVKHYSSSSANDDMLLSQNVTDKKTKPALTPNNCALTKKNQISLSANNKDRSEPSEKGKITEQSVFNTQSEAFEVNDAKSSAEDTESAPLLAISETDSEEDIPKKAVRKAPKSNSNTQINATEVKSLSGSPNTIRRIKFCCEKCKKKFNDPLTLEYHRISFHVEEDAASLDREKSSTGRRLPKGNKLDLKPDVSMGTQPNKKTLNSKQAKISDSETEIPKLIIKKRAGPERKVTPAKKQKVVVHDKAKSSCLTGIFRKHNPSDSSEDESQIKRHVNYNKSNILQSKSLHLKHNAQDSSSDSNECVQQVKVKGNLKAKKQIASRAKNMKRSKVKGITNYGADKNEMSDEETFQNQKVNPKILLPDVNTLKSSSDSEEVHVSHNSEAFVEETTADINSERKNKDTAKNLSMKNQLISEGKRTIPDSSESEKKYIKKGPKTKQSQLKKGGELKDIYTARNRRKIDYFEISDIEESDENIEEKKSVQVNKLNVANKADISSDESDFEVNKVIKKKVLKKKIAKKKSDTSEEESESPTTLKSSSIKKKTQITKSNSSEDEHIRLNFENSNLPISKTALKLFQKKVRPTEVRTSEDEILLKTNLESRKINQPKISESDKSSLDDMLLSTDEDESLKGFYKSEDSKSEGSHFHYKNKTVHDIISLNVKSNEKLVTSDSEPEIVKKETVKTDTMAIELDESDGNESVSYKIREKISTKSDKVVKCGNCNKALKSSDILQYHQLHCIAHNKSISSGQNHLVEKKIISSKKSNLSESAVDMILKKLSEKVENSPSPSPNSTLSYNFFQNKKAEVKSPEILRSQNTRHILEVKCKICGIYNDPKSILEHIKEFHDEKISVDVKKISKLDLNRYKPDDDDDIEKAKGFDLSDEENSSCKNEDKTSKSEDVKAEKKSQIKDLNKIVNKIKTFKSSSLGEAEETKQLETSNSKEVAGDSIGSPQFNQINKDKRKGKSIDKVDDKLKRLSPTKKLSKIISDEDDSFDSDSHMKKTLNVGVRKTYQKDTKIHKDNKCEIKKGWKTFNKDEVSEQSGEVSQTKINVQTVGWKTSSIPEKTLAHQNQTLNISDISDDDVLSPVQANEQSNFVDQSSQHIAIMQSSVEDSHIVHSDDLGKKEFILDEAKISTIDEEPVKKKKKSKKEKKKKSKKKSKKSKHKRHHSTSSESEEEERKKKRKKKHKKHHNDSEVSESPALDTSRTSVEEEKEFKGKGEKEIEFEGKGEEEKELEGKDEEEKESEEKDEEEQDYCFCAKPETEDMIGCDFCSMWFHPECIGLDEDQAVSLTKSDWMCPECEETKRSRKGQGRGRPKKQETKRSSPADNDWNKKGEEAAVTEKFPKKTVSVKTVSKKQIMSKEYISDKDMTDTEEETNRAPSPDLRKFEKENVKTNPPKNKPSFNASLKTVDKNKAGSKVESQEAKKGREMVQKGFVTMSDSLSDSSVGVEDGSARIIRIPMDASQLNQSYSTSDED